MTTISELKKRKKEWLDSTVNEAYLRKELKLKTNEIENMKSEIKYGKKRYDKHYVAKYIGFGVFD